VKGISNKAMAQLLSYPWPGNVREMENIIQHAMVSTRAEIISDFPELGKSSHTSPPAAPASGAEEPTIWVDAGEGNDYHSIKQSLVEQFEKKYLAYLMDKHGGVIAEAARESGLNYKTFYLKVEKYQLTKKRDRSPL
jgi:DNA-binding NtrC family response regulator